MSLCQGCQGVLGPWRQASLGQFPYLQAFCCNHSFDCWPVMSLCQGCQGVLGLYPCSSEYLGPLQPSFLDQAPGLPASWGPCRPAAWGPASLSAGLDQYPGLPASWGPASLSAGLDQSQQLGVAWGPFQPRL